jgi:hypothetical protein
LGHLSLCDSAMQQDGARSPRSAQALRPVTTHLLRRPFFVAVTVAHFPFAVSLAGRFLLIELGMQRQIVAPLCTENLIRVDDVMESPKLAE